MIKQFERLIDKKQKIQISIRTIIDGDYKNGKLMLELLTKSLQYTEKKLKKLSYLLGI